MAAHEAPPSLGFSRQEHWSGLPCPSPMHESEVTESSPTLSDPMDCGPPDSSLHGIFQARVLLYRSFVIEHEFSARLCLCRLRVCFTLSGDVCKLIFISSSSPLNGKSNLQKVSCQTVMCLQSNYMFSGNTINSWWPGSQKQRSLRRELVCK